MASKYFNINGLCLPGEHYMVDLTSRLASIKEMIGKGQYFCINRGRQYGKTTTLWALRDYLKDDYAVISLDFQTLDVSDFETSKAMAAAFCRQFLKRAKRTCLADGNGEALRLIEEYLKDRDEVRISTLSDLLTEVCEASPKPVVMLIDEVDQASNFEVFVGFLAMLRQKYLDRAGETTFQSVILAGVHDIRHLKSKIRPDSEHNKLNSPWNIAAPFKVQMGFLPEEIAGMLRQYEADHNTGMDVAAVAEALYEYTSGYPVMVCWLCKQIDEESLPWDAASVGAAAKQMVYATPMPDVFGSMVSQLGAHPDLNALLEEIVFNGKTIGYNQMDYTQSLGVMLSYLKVDKENHLQVDNRIFEMLLVNNYMNRMMTEPIYGRALGDRDAFTRNGRLDMDRILTKYAAHFSEIYGGKDGAFVEKFGRKLFVLYIKPILNGAGNYYMEAQTRDDNRTDLIIDYKGERHIVEMKVWRGDSYNERGEEQLAEYLDYYKLKKGYLLSYCFNKNKPKEPIVRTVKVGDGEILEAVV